MSDEEPIPVFIPPLALVLAHAERAQGRALGATEVEALRDQASCVMMHRTDAEALRGERGFRDVEPEDCWADWQRLRVQLTGQGYLPKIVLCAVGGNAFAERATALLEAAGVEHEVRGPDPRMVVAFEASAMGLAPSFGSADRARVAGHRRVVYALSPNFVAGDALATSARFLELGTRLLDACGGDGLKCESSGIAHGRDRWLELGAQLRERPDDLGLAALVRAFVQFPIGEDDVYWSCGMHLLGRPDMIAAPEVLGSGAGVQEIAALFDAFAHYLVCECGEHRHFASGATFRLSAEDPRLRVTWEPCTGYDEDEFFFNPFGRWRFAPA